MTYRKVRPKNYKSSDEEDEEDEEKEAFKTDLPKVVEKLEEQYGIKPRLFFMDEHRMGLQPILRKQWLFPEQKFQEIHIGYKWLWVYGFVQPNTGENHHYLFANLNTGCFQLSLKEFAKDVNKCIKTFDEMFEKVMARCKWMMEEGTEKVKALTNYHWLPGMT